MEIIIQIILKSLIIFASKLSNNKTLIVGIFHFKHVNNCTYFCLYLV